MRRRATTLFRNALADSSPVTGGDASFAGSLLRNRCGQQAGFATATPSGFASDPLRDANALRSWSTWLLVPALGALGLGSWQIQRMGEKEDLIQLRRRMLAADPVPLLDLPDEPAEYTPVTATGRFEHRRAFYVGLRIKHIQGRAEAGYNLIVPFRTSDGRAVVLVNRGWVPRAYKDFPAVRAKYEPNEEVTIRAFVSRSERGPGFATVYSERQDTWLWTDAEAMCDAIDLPHDTPLLTVMDAREDFPDVDTMTFEDFRNELEKQRAAKESQGSATAAEDGRVGSGLSASGPGSGNRKGSLEGIELPIGKSSKDMLRFAVMPEGHLGYAVTWYGIGLVAIFMAVRARRRARDLLDQAFQRGAAAGGGAPPVPLSTPPGSGGAGRGPPGGH